MTLLVGIDEAGYGPHLGPLVVAAAAMEFRGDALPDPDLWPALAEHVHKRPAGAKGRVIICDSKIAHAGPRGDAHLERAVLGALAAMGRRPRNLDELLATTNVANGAQGIPAGVPSSVTLSRPDGTCEGSRCGCCLSDGQQPQPQRDSSASLREGRNDNVLEVPPLPEPWHQPQAMALPQATTGAEIASAAEQLRAGLGGINGAVGGFWVNVASPARFNRLIDGGRNKAAALFALAADLLAAVQHHRPRDPILVTMDRHGGRRYYAEMLSAAFPMTAVETLEESPAQSRYRLQRSHAGAAVEIVVRDKCETWSLATALASMAAKYVRELHMLQLNAYFQSHVPGLRATAGYGLDAWRFLDDVAAARAAAGVPDAAILRSR